MNCIEIKKIMLIPFVDGGRTYAGCDCLGLTILLFKEYEIDIPDFKISCSETLKVDSNVRSELKIGWKRIDKPVEPCLVVMSTSSKYSKMCNHLGVYIGDEIFLHTMKKIGVSKTKIDHPFYKHRIKGYYVPC